jgi:hypothetical protein
MEKSEDSSEASGNTNISVHLHPDQEFWPSVFSLQRLWMAQLQSLTQLEATHEFTGIAGASEAATSFINLLQSLLPDTKQKIEQGANPNIDDAISFVLENQEILKAINKNGLQVDIDNYGEEHFSYYLESIKGSLPVNAKTLPLWGTAPFEQRKNALEL